MKIGGKWTARAVSGPAAVCLAHGDSERVNLVEEARVTGCRVGRESRAGKFGECVVRWANR